MCIFGDRVAACKTTVTTVSLFSIKRNKNLLKLQCRLSQVVSHVVLQGCLEGKNIYYIIYIYFFSQLCTLEFDFFFSPHYFIQHFELDLFFLAIQTRILDVNFNIKPTAERGKI